MGKPYEFNIFISIYWKTSFFFGVSCHGLICRIPYIDLLWGPPTLEQFSGQAKGVETLERLPDLVEGDVSTSAGSMSLRISFPVSSFFCVCVCHVLQEKVNIFLQGFAADHD